VEIVNDKNHIDDGDALSLNIVGANNSCQSRLSVTDALSGAPYFEIEAEEEEMQEASSATAATTPHKWTQAMNSYYNGAVRGYATANLESLRRGMDAQPASWHVDRCVVCRRRFFVVSSLFDIP
jgi:hypothetical protein